jgi:diaminopimelate decarboxylase
VIGRLVRSGRAVAKQRIGPIVARRQPVRTDLPLSTWGLGIGPTGTVWSDGLDLAAVVAEHGSPLHVVRGDRLDANARAAMAASDAADVFTSYKTNPVPAVLARLHERGVGAEVISPYELWLAVRLGVAGDRLIYNGPAKSADSIRVAIRHRALLVNANSASDAALIARLAAEEQRVVNLGLRVTVPGAWIAQFGILDIDAAASAVRRALDDPWVDLRGLHVHRGLTIRTATTMASYVRAVLRRAGELRERTGWNPAILDIGGSLACPTSAAVPRRQFRLNRALGTDVLPPDPADCITIADAARLAGELVRADAEVNGYAAPHVVLEPGRALTGDTQFLLTSVIDVNAGALPHAILDAGINVAEPVTSEYHQLVSVTSPGLPATTAYRLAGPICTPADVLYQHWRLPALAPGHVLAIMDTGAYFVPFSTTFSFPKPAIVIQDGTTTTVARRRETYDDMTGYDVWSGQD